VLAGPCEPRGESALAMQRDTPLAHLFEQALELNGPDPGSWGTETEVDEVRLRFGRGMQDHTVLRGSVAHWRRPEESIVLQQAMGQQLAVWADTMPHGLRRISGCNFRVHMRAHQGRRTTRSQEHSYRKVSTMYSRGVHHAVSLVSHGYLAQERPRTNLFALGDRSR
jgi:hypothetical protein